MSAVLPYAEKLYVIDDTNGSATGGGYPSEVYYEGTLTFTDYGSNGYGAYGSSCTLPVSETVGLQNFLIGAGCWIDGSTMGIIYNTAPAGGGSVIIYITTLSQIASGSHTIKIGGKTVSTNLSTFFELLSKGGINATNVGTDSSPEYRRNLFTFRFDSDASFSSLRLPDTKDAGSADTRYGFLYNLNENTLAISGSITNWDNMDATNSVARHVFYNGTMSVGGISLSQATGSIHSVCFKQVNISSSSTLLFSDTDKLHFIGTKATADKISCSGIMSVAASRIETTNATQGLSAEQIWVYRSYIESYELDGTEGVFATKSQIDYTSTTTDKFIAYDSLVNITGSITAPNSLLIGDGIAVASSNDDVIYDETCGTGKITEVEEIPDPPQILDIDDFGGAIEYPPSFLEATLGSPTSTKDTPHYFAGVVQPYIFDLSTNFAYSTEYITNYITEYGALKLQEPIEDIIYRLARILGYQPDLDEKAREQIIDSLNTAVQIITTSYDWNFMRNKTNFTLREGVFEYNLSEEGYPYSLIDCYRIKSIRYNTDDYSDFLEKKPYHYIERQIAERDITTGRPTQYGLFKPDKLIFNKKPDQDYTLSVIYQRHHPSIQVIKALLIPSFLIPAVIQLAKLIFKAESTINDVPLLQNPIVSSLIQNAIAQDADMQYDMEQSTPGSYSDDYQEKITIEIE